MASLACLMASPVLADRSRKVKVIYAPGMGIQNAAPAIVPPLRPEPVIVRPRLLWNPWGGINRAVFHNSPCFCRLYSGPRHPF